MTSGANVRRVRLYFGRLRKRIGAGVLRGLQIRWESGEPGSGGFDSHTLPPALPSLVVLSKEVAMKKVIALAVAVVAIWLGANFYRTGQLSFFPTMISPEAQKLHDLEQELASV